MRWVRSLEAVVSAHNPILARDSAAVLRSSEDPERQRWEQHEIESLEASGVPETEREAIVDLPM
jgi:hypothetical protein